LKFAHDATAEEKVKVAEKDHELAVIKEAFEIKNKK